MGHDNDGAPEIFNGVASDNVVLDSVDIPEVPTKLPRAQGINVLNAAGAGIQIINNIISHATGPSTVNQIGVALNGGVTGNPVTGVIVSGNYIYSWQTPVFDFGSTPSGAVLSNAEDANGANNLGSPEPFPGPNRDVGSYDTTLGGPGTLADFLAQARLQSADNWNTALMADPVNTYIRAGFGVASDTLRVISAISSGSPTTTSATITWTTNDPATSEVVFGTQVMGLLRHPQRWSPLTQSP